MKKIISLALVMVLMLSMGTMAFAEKTTTLTTTVPDATYTLNIPADQTIAYGTESCDIGTVTVTNAEYFAPGKNVNVTINFSGEFTSEDVSTTIPYTLIAGDPYHTNTTKKFQDVSDGQVWSFAGLSGGGVREYAGFSATASTLVGDTFVDYEVIRMRISGWGKALGGDYTAKITFTSEIVVP